MAQTSGVIRAAFLGAAAAFVLGGGWLLYSGVMAHYGLADCADLTPEECTFEHEGFKAVGRIQSFAGTAMFILGLAMYVLWRKPPDAGPAPVDAERKSENSP